MSYLPDIELVKVLLCYGANPHVKIDNKTTLMLATSKCAIKVGKLLLEYDGDTLELAVVKDMMS